MAQLAGTPPYAARTNAGSRVTTSGEIVSVPQEASRLISCATELIYLYTTAAG